MLSHVTSVWRSFRRRFSRSEWAIRLLRLSTDSDAASQPGLLLVQVDGLSGAQLRRALAQGRMPFVQRLLRRERYLLHTQYSGLPASTPAVQAELFYGVKGAVPAFSFLDKSCGCIFRMYEPKSAAEVERRLAEQGPALLDGGSAYTDIFTGGAKESHFCASTLGLNKLLRSLHPLVMPILILSRLDLVLRIAVLLVVELVLAVIDSVRGALSKKGLLDEIFFIPTRVAICILLRELVVLGAQTDLARGLPIIHVNLIGYDEQAHRRGPSSRFAHWTLRGIDYALARLWHAAHRSARRDYDVWIYSDHGQEDALPYMVLHGRSVQQAVQELVQRIAPDGPVKGEDGRGVQAHRAGLLAGPFWRQVFAKRERVDDGRPHLTVTAMGSLGHVYPPRRLTRRESDWLAGELVRTAGIPLVLRAEEAHKATAWTTQRAFRLPEDAATLFGAGHPFLEEIASDLVDVCHHPDAGQLVISGWQSGGRPISFPMEYGSHTGPGREETNAFALLPADAPLPGRLRPYLRPWDVREAGHRLLGRAIVEVAEEPRSPAAESQTFRVMTYNVHSCVGMDGKVSPSRIARIIARHRPDIVSLQELDVGRPRTGRVDQAARIGEKLGMQCCFHPALRIGDGQYGNAILSRDAMRLVKADWLPRLRAQRPFQPRAALWVAVERSGYALQVINAHLSLWPKERLLQVEALLGDEWLGHADCRPPVVLCGDFNATPGSSVCRRLGRRLLDAQRVLAAHRPLRTWSGRYPTHRIDHVFVGPRIEVVSIEVPNTELEKIASDHLPVIVEVRIVEHAAPGGSGLARNTNGQARQPGRTGK